MAKSFSQVEGIDYSKTFSPIAKTNSIRFALSLFAFLGWLANLMDVNNAFQHGDLCEKIYMEKMLGFVQDSSHVCKLYSLYGLKKTPRAWYEDMDKFLCAFEFTRYHSYPTIDI